ncbi:MAG: ABC transporter ATP-binding protein, partial [Actinomycetota bacterium]
MAGIVLEDVTKRYDDGTLAVDKLNLGIEDGEFMVFVGPSGCGKTTALRMIAGLETITEGKLSIGERVVNEMQPKDRDIAMVFQNYALYPHMSVYDNMAFGLKLAKIDKGEIDNRVKEAARVLGLEEYLSRKPRALSGGQRQRVAMGRAIVRKPQAFLMDEPLSNLDAKLRVQMRSEIARIQNDLEVTTVYVTHDQIEAMTMGDRVAVIKKGELQQVGSPTELFEHPDNLFVAGFIGSPSMNFAQSRIEDAGGGISVKLGEQTLKMSEKDLSERPGLKKHAGKEVVLGIRPQDFEDPEYAQDAPEGSKLKVKIDMIEAVGTE